jgi:hypothetical protein
MSVKKWSIPDIFNEAGGSKLITAKLVILGTKIILFVCLIDRFLSCLIGIIRQILISAKPRKIRVEEYVFWSKYGGK